MEGVELVLLRDSRESEICITQQKGGAKPVEWMNEWNHFHILVMFYSSHFFFFFLILSNTSLYNFISSRKKIIKLNSPWPKSHPRCGTNLHAVHLIATWTGQGPYWPPPSSQAPPIPVHCQTPDSVPCETGSSWRTWHPLQTADRTSPTTQCSIPCVKVRIN